MLSACMSVMYVRHDVCMYVMYVACGAYWIQQMTYWHIRPTNYNHLHHDFTYAEHHAKVDAVQVLHRYVIKSNIHQSVCSIR